MATSSPRGGPAMKPTDFTRHLTAYLGKYVPEHRNYQPNTVCAYRDVFRLLLHFGNDVRRIKPDRITLSDLSYEFIADFLGWLRDERHCGIATVNHRLAAIRAFFDYIQMEEPELLLTCQRIRKIPFRKTSKAPPLFISKDAVRALLVRPEGGGHHSLRDMTMLSTMYDAAIRVQELLDLRVKDLRFESPATITVIGKGDKTRTVPVMKGTVRLLREHVESLGYDASRHGERTLFCNSRGVKLTRVGVTYVLKKYAALIRNEGHNLPVRLSPHLLRHTRAIHLLREGVPLIYIRDFLGHVDIKTTQIYANVDFETKREAIEKSSMRIDLPAQLSWERDGNIMEWLERLCEK